MLKERIITAVVLLLLLLASMFMLPALGWALLITLVVLQASVEWSNLAKLTATTARLYWWVILASMCALVWFDTSTSAAQQMTLHMMVYGMSLALWVVVPVWMLVGWKIENPPVLMLVGWALIVPTGLAMMDLRQYSPWLLLGLMVLVWVADSAAYFVGRKYGRNKLAPSISPGKTWEGVIGAIFAVSVYVVLVWSFSGYNRYYAYIPNILIASWCWVGLSVLGDLFESAVKRQAGVKDSGALLPGHGGLLDRIDALTSTLPLAAMALLIQKIP
jgi:phosphatidate cytidylyltransferase